MGSIDLFHKVVLDPHLFGMVTLRFEQGSSGKALRISVSKAIVPLMKYWDLQELCQSEQQRIRA